MKKLILFLTLIVWTVFVYGQATPNLPTTVKITQAAAFLDTSTSNVWYNYTVGSNTPFWFQQIPPQTGQSGKVLGTDGTNLGWVTGGGGGGAVSSVSNSDGTLTISPTVGAVVASLNRSHANTWLATQTFFTSTSSIPSIIIPAGLTYTGTTVGSIFNDGELEFRNTAGRYSNLSDQNYINNGIAASTRNNSSGGGSINLTKTANYSNIFTGVGSWSVYLPDVTTYSTNWPATSGNSFKVSNGTTQLLAVYDFNGDLVQIINPGETAIFTNVANTNVAASWKVDYMSNLSTTSVSGYVWTANNTTGGGSWQAASGSTGTVTTVSGVAANGFTWSIANPNTTPAITLTQQNASTTLDGKLTHTDWNTFNGKQAAITTGTTAQYFRGDLSLATFPTNLSSFTNGPGYITANQNITLSGAVTGSGTTAIATTLANSVVGIANLTATGTPSSSTYYRGDNTWATVSGGGTPGGAGGELQFNAGGGVFGGVTNAVYNSGTGNLGISNVSPHYTLDVGGVINTSSYYFLSYAVGSGGGLLGIASGTNTFQMGFSTAGDYGGTPSTLSGAEFFVYDFQTSQHYWGFATGGDSFYGPNSTSYSLKIQQPNASNIPLSILGASSQTANLFNISANGGSTGGILSVFANGDFSLNNITDDPNLLFQVNSTTKGVSFSRMTTTQRLAISSPTESEIVYDLTLHAYYYWNGTAWVTPL